MSERIAKGVPQADPSIRPEPRREVAALVSACTTMVLLPFATVMAPKRPFVGRG